MKIFFSLLMMLVCTTSGCVLDNEPDGPSKVVGDTLPKFEVIMNDGRIISDSSLKNKVAAIVFFNTDCSDCRKELPVIQQLWDRYKEMPDVEIVPIAREESEKEILDFWKANGLNMPFSPQSSREVYSLFASNVIPRIYISDPQGTIVAAYDDSNMPSLQDLVNEIENLL